METVNFEHDHSGGKPDENLYNQFKAQSFDTDRPNEKFDNRNINKSPNYQAENEIFDKRINDMNPDVQVNILIDGEMSYTKRPNDVSKQNTGQSQARDETKYKFEIEFPKQSENCDDQFLGNIDRS